MTDRTHSALTERKLSQITGIMTDLKRYGNYSCIIASCPLTNNHLGLRPDRTVVVFYHRVSQHKNSPTTLDNTSLIRKRLKWTLESLPRTWSTVDINVSCDLNGPLNRLPLSKTFYLSFQEKKNKIFL